MPGPSFIFNHFVLNMYNFPFHLQRFFNPYPQTFEVGWKERACIAIFISMFELL